MSAREEPIRPPPAGPHPKHAARPPVPQPIPLPRPPPKRPKKPKVKKQPFDPNSLFPPTLGPAKPGPAPKPENLAAARKHLTENYSSEFDDDRLEPRTLPALAGVRDRLTPAVLEKYLELIRTNGRKIEAARRLNINFGTICMRARKDPDFAFQLEMAAEEYREKIEAEIDRRGRLGWDEPVFYQGEYTGDIRRYDGNLLLELARRHIPEYRKGHVPPPQDTSTLGLDSLSLEDREALRKLLAARQKKTIDVAVSSETTSDDTDKIK